MKKSIRVFVPTATIFLVLGFLGCAPQQNTNTAATNANTAMAAATPDKAAIEAELTRIENDWPRVIRERDANAVRRVEADDAILVYPDGTLGSKDRDISDVGSGALTADSWVVSDIKVNVIDADSAVVGVRSTVTNGKYKAPDGRVQNISGQFRSVDTFARRNGQWQLVGSASAQVVNPTAAAPAMRPSPMASPAMKATPAMKPSPAMKASPAMRSAAPAKTP
jgi:ketosteroid isomerase-like protein